MSQQNIDRFHETIAAFNEGDVDGMLRTFAPDAEFHPFSATIEGDRPYRGHDGIRLWWKNVEATTEAIEAHVDDVRDLGDTILGLGQLQARSASGVALRTECGWVFRYRDGVTVWASTHQSHAEALEAAGLPQK